MNPELETTLDDAVAEVLGLLTGLDLQYAPELDRYQAITRQINRAMRSCAMEKEWSWFADLQSVGAAVSGEQEVILPSSKRPRVIGDDSVRLVDDQGIPRVWAYFLPRDAINKYVDRVGLWVAATRQSLLPPACRPARRRGSRQTARDRWQSCSWRVGHRRTLPGALARSTSSPRC